MDSPSLPQLELTRILQAWSGGDESALHRLTPIVYAELHRIAQHNMAGERDHHLLQPSALVNEAFVRLIGGVPVQWTSRTHFYAVSARLMRQILIDIARAQDTDKRGHGATQIGLSDIEDLAGAGAPPIDFLDLDAALRDLSSRDRRRWSSCATSAVSTHPRLPRSWGSPSQPWGATGAWLGLGYLRGFTPPTASKEETRYWID